MEELILALAMKYPAAVSVFMVIGVCRAVFKPLQGVIDNYVAATPSPDDDTKWAAFKESKAFKGIAWFLDYTASIKIKKQEPAFPAMPTELDQKSLKDL